MYEETMREIQQTSKERLNLYMLAGQGGLTPQQLQRLHQLNDAMPLLWDRYRREFAGSQNHKTRVDTLMRAA